MGRVAADPIQNQQPISFFPFHQATENPAIPRAAPIPPSEYAQSHPRFWRQWRRALGSRVSMFCQIMFGDPGRSIGRHGESYPLYGLRSTSLLRPKLVVVQHRRCLLAVNHPWRSPSVPYPYSSSPPSVLHPSRLMRLLITLGLGQRISEILQSGANFDRDRVDMSSDNGLHLRWYCSNRFAPDQHSSSLQLCLIQSLFRHTNYVCELDEQLRKIHSIPILQWESSDVNPSLE